MSIFKDDKAKWAWIVFLSVSSLAINILIWNAIFGYTKNSILKDLPKPSVIPIRELGLKSRSNEYYVCVCVAKDKQGNWYSNTTINQTGDGTNCYVKGSDGVSHLGEAQDCKWHLQWFFPSTTINSTTMTTEG